MATGITIDGKPVQAGDQVTVVNGFIASVSLPNITVTLRGSGLSITSAYSNFDGPTASGTAAAATPSVGDQVELDGVVASVSGSGVTATVVVTPITGATVSVQAQDLYASQSL